MMRKVSFHTVGITKEESEIASLCQKGLEGTHRRKLEMQPELDLFGEECKALEYEQKVTVRVVANIDNILINAFQ